MEPLSRNLFRKQINGYIMIKKIADVVNNGLCCCCGTCEGICPQDAIKLQLDKYGKQYVPILDEIKCNECNICLKVCPGYSVDFKSLNRDLFGKQPDDILMGNYLKCYLGYSLDNKIRFLSASGGVVTTLLIYALENGIIDGALVTRMKKENPIEPEPFIAKTRKEIIEASKSKYCPVPTNILIKEIINSKEKNIAIVGVPCQIHGIRNSEKINKNLKNKIKLHLGLVCAHTNTFWFSHNALKELNINKSDVANLSFRGYGWPGEMQVKQKNPENDNLQMKKNVIPYNSLFKPHLIWVNSLYRCLFCCDYANEFSDLSFGDPWIPKIMENEKIGQTLVISRTKTAERLLLNAIHDNYIKINETSTENVKIAGSYMESKKKDVVARLRIRRVFNSNVPKYDIKLLNPGLMNYLKGYVTYQNTFLSSKVYLRRFMPILTKIGWFLFKRTVRDNIK